MASWRYAEPLTLVDRGAPRAHDRVTDHPDQHRSKTVAPTQFLKTPHRAPHLRHLPQVPL